MAACYTLHLTAMLQRVLELGGSACWLLAVRMVMLLAAAYCNPLLSTTCGRFGLCVGCSHCMRCHQVYSSRLLFRVCFALCSRRLLGFGVAPATQLPLLDFPNVTAAMLPAAAVPMLVYSSASILFCSRTCSAVVCLHTMQCSSHGLRSGLPVCCY
jgi:hypothetical protein